MTAVTFKYPTGIKATDKASGFEGIITSRSELLNGCIKYAVQPQVTKQGEYPDSYDIDEQDIMPAKGSYKPESHTFKYRIGDEVKSLINGYRGIIVMRILDLNKCERYVIEGKFSKEGKRVNVHALQQEIKVIGKGLNKELEPKKAYTGCPATKSVRA